MYQVSFLLYFFDVKMQLHNSRRRRIILNKLTLNTFFTCSCPKAITAYKELHVEPGDLGQGGLIGAFVALPCNLSLTMK
jgi:hypothetical protein